RVGCPPDGHFMPHVFCEAFSFKSFSLQVGDRVASPFVDQNVLALMLIHTSGHGCGTGLAFVGRLLFFLLLTGLSKSRTRGDSRQVPDERKSQQRSGGKWAI